MIIINQQGSQILLNWMLNGGVQSCTLHLFQQNIIPNVINTISDFEAAEANFDGYSALPLTAGNWVVGLDSTYAAIAQYPVTLPLWTCSGNSNIIYGYYVTETAGSGSGTLLWAEAISPITVNSGDEFSVQPQITFRGQK